MIKFAVCDDEAFMREDVAARISTHAKERNIPCQVRCFNSGKLLLESKEHFNILFLDIQMEKPDGMETAKFLREKGFRGLLIFMTVLKERVFDAFEVQAFDYLIKPIDNIRFCRTIERAIRFVEDEVGKSIMLQSGSACQVILFSQIVYCEVMGRKVYFHMHNGEVASYYSRLDDLQKQLDSRFYRCHRSYIVNLDYVRGHRAGFVMLLGNGDIPLSRLREQEFTETLLNRMKGRLH